MARTGCEPYHEIVGNCDSVLRNITLENVVSTVRGKGPASVAVATEPLRLVNCTFNGVREPDGARVTPRGKRQKLVRTPGVSWETLRQPKAR